MIMKKYENFVRALENFHEIETREPPYDVVAMTGMVFLFKICFDQAWKAMKEQLELCGDGDHRTGSPRAVIKMAYQAGMTQDEQLWLDALTARNNVAHSYNENIAMGIIKESRERFIPMFEAVKQELKQNWIG